MGVEAASGVIRDTPTSAEPTANAYEQMAEGIGEMVGVMYEFYRQARLFGFEQEQAFGLTKIFLAETVRGNFNGDHMQVR